MFKILINRSSDWIRISINVSWMLWFKPFYHYFCGLFESSRALVVQAVSHYTNVLELWEQNAETATTKNVTAAQGVRRLRIMDKLLKTQACIPSSTDYYLHILGYPHSAGKVLTPFQETGFKEMWYPWQSLHSINSNGSLAFQISVGKF